MLRLVAAVAMVLVACSTDGTGLRNDLDAAAVAVPDVELAGTGGSGSGGQSVVLVGTGGQGSAMGGSGGQQAPDARPGTGGASVDAWVAPVGTGGSVGSGGTTGSGGAVAIDGGSNRDAGTRDTWEDRDIPPDLSGVDLRPAVLPKCDSPDWPDCATVRFPKVLCSGSAYLDLGVDGGRTIYASSCGALCGRCAP